MAIVEELKARLAHITNEINELQNEVEKLTVQKAAFETVIKTYDPDRTQPYFNQTQERIAKLTEQTRHRSSEGEKQSSRRLGDRETGGTAHYIRGNRPTVHHQ